MGIIFIVIVIACFNSDNTPIFMCVLFQYFIKRPIRDQVSISAKINQGPKGRTMELEVVSEDPTEYIR